MRTEFSVRRTGCRPPRISASKQTPKAAASGPSACVGCVENERPHRRLLELASFGQGVTVDGGSVSMGGFRGRRPVARHTPVREIVAVSCFCKVQTLVWYHITANNQNCIPALVVFFVKMQGHPCGFNAYLVFPAITGMRWDEFYEEAFISSPSRDDEIVANAETFVLSRRTFPSGRKLVIKTSALRSASTPHFSQSVVGATR